MLPPTKCPSPCFPTMVDLTFLQQRLHIALQQIVPCFLRVNTADDSLFISDFSRKRPDWKTAAKAAESLGFLAFLDEASQLLHFDLSWEKYEELSRMIFAQMPDFPADDEELPLFSLCRLLLAHPAPLSAQPMNLNRKILKLIFYPRLFTSALPQLQAECAVLLRNHSPLPHLGGQFLAAALSKKGDF